MLLLELVDRSGVGAWSECVARARPDYSPETIDTAALAISAWLAARILGREFEHPSEVFPVLDQDLRGHLMAKAALEMGAWALAAAVDEMPLAELLGGARRSVPTGISLGIEETPDDLAERIHTEIEKGYRRIKVKIAPGRDRAYLEAARTAVGRAVPLTADANAAYPPSAAARLRDFDAFGLAMLEQPFDGRDLLAHAELQAGLSMPLCLDESIESERDVEAAARLEAGRVVNIKPARVGGLARAMRIHDLCAEHGIGVWCGGMLETGIGRACNVALASLPHFTSPGDLSPSKRYWERDIVDPEWTMSADGMVRVPRSEAGIGVTVDRERVEALTVRSETLRPA